MDEQQLLLRLEELERRLSIQQRILDDRLLRVETNRLFAYWRRISTGVSRMFSRFEGAAEERAQASDYLVWLAHEQAALPSVEDARERIRLWPARPLVCFRGIDDKAVAAQVYPHVSRAGLGDFVCFVSEGYEISPWAAYFIAETAAETGCDLVYADEDSVENGRRYGPVFKPRWSPQLLESCMYFGGLFAARRELLADTGDPSHTSPHEIASRLASTARRIEHVPRMLSHRAVVGSSGGWRADSIDGAPPNLPAAVATPGMLPGCRVLRPREKLGPVDVVVCSRTARLVERCLDSVRATAGPELGELIVVAHEERGPDEPLRAAARRRGAATLPFTGPFNFSAMNNMGAAASRSSYLLFLNDDVVATQPGWLEPLLFQAARNPIGAAGALLTYPDGRIQHAGIALGIGEAVGHIGRGSRNSCMWPWLRATRNVSAVTGACLAIRADLFREVGGFDPAYPSNYNDVDLCLRLRERGCEVVCVAVPGLVHAECQTRQGVVRFSERYRLYRRWGAVLERPDPFYSSALAPTEQIALDIGSA